MAKLTKDELIKAIEEMSVLELSEVVKVLEEKFGVSAAPVAMAVAGNGGGNGEAAEPKEEQTIFNVVLASSGANKIAVIKAVRELNQTLGLKDAKDMVDAAPKELMTGVSKEKATEAKQKLEAAGAKVELK